jgi:hypothetical protein
LFLRRHGLGDGQGGGGSAHVVNAVDVGSQDVSDR